jgi:hypothetical protein
MSGEGWRTQQGSSLAAIEFVVRTGSAQDLPITQDYRRNSGHHSWHRVFDVYDRSSGEFFLLLGKI